VNEILNKIRKGGIIGCLLSMAAAYFTQYGTFVYLVWPDTDERWGVLRYPIRSVARASYLHLIVGILVALALLASIPAYSNKISKALSGAGALASLASVVLTLQWLLPNADALNVVDPEIPITPPQLLQLETLLVQGFIAAFLSLLLVGIAGIAERGPDKVANAGYILSLLGGLIPLMYGLSTSGFVVSTYGDSEWALFSYVISVVGYLGLGVVFYRPIPRPGSHPDIQEQETDSQT